MIVIYHSKDNDGNTSGAICKLVHQNATLIGWDYGDGILDFNRFIGEDVIMIDVTFPIDKIIELSQVVNTLTIIDHHISFKRDFERVIGVEVLDSYGVNKYGNITYVFELGIAACEVAWKYFFPESAVPLCVLLVGKYDTWRDYGTGQWESMVIPFKYGILCDLKSPETFPKNLFYNDTLVYPYIESGEYIMEYEKVMNETTTKQNSFERLVYGGLRALCINQPFFSSEVMVTKYDENNHDILIGFVYSKDKWAVSLRSTKQDVDVSVIAKQRGGGGHKAAAGFEVNSFEDIFN